MGNYPCCFASGKIKGLLSKIQDVGKPSKLTLKWLATVGFTSSTDRQLVGLLKALGFVDASNAPTERWMEYRHRGNAPTVLAQAVQEAYAELYAMYGNAHERSDDELKNFFSQKTGGGARMIAGLVGTFRNAAELADFSYNGTQSLLPSAGEQADQESRVPTLANQQKTRDIPRNHSLGVCVNVQIVIPETADERMIDSIFCSLSRHLHIQG